MLGMGELCLIFLYVHFVLTQEKYEKERNNKSKMCPMIFAHYACAILMHFVNICLHA